MQPDRGLDRELRDLGARVEYPPVPDLAGSIRSRLEAEDGDAPPARGPQLWWIAAAAIVLLVALPVFASVLNTMGGAFSGGASGGGGMAGGGAEGGSVAESGGQEARDAAGPTRLVQEDESLAAGAGEDDPESGGGEEAAGNGIRAAKTPNDEPVPNVVGAPVLEACSKLQTRDYNGYVLGEVRNERVAPGHVVSQEPRVGHKGFEGQPVELIVSEPYPAEKLGRDSRCYDLTEYGPGGKPNVPNNVPD